MKKKLLKLLPVFAACGMMLAAACNKEEDTTGKPVDEGAFSVVKDGKTVMVKNLVADTIIGQVPGGQPYGSGKFTFFSLVNGTLVSNADSATTKWDIAFRGTTILINGGTSGPGNGGAFIWQGAYENLLEIPADSVFRVDNIAATGYAIPAGSNKGWYSYNGTANLITPIPGRVMVIRTANGKFAKVEILNYYRKGVTPAATDTDEVKLKNQRFITWRYSYQPDGTRKF